MKRIAPTRNRCPDCRTKLLRIDGKAQCPNWQCALSPLAGLAAAKAVRAADSPPPGYRYADHQPPQAHHQPRRATPVARPPDPPTQDKPQRPKPRLRHTDISPDVYRDLLLADERFGQ